MSAPNSLDVKEIEEMLGSQTTLEVLTESTKDLKHLSANDPIPESDTITGSIIKLMGIIEGCDDEKTLSIFESLYKEVEYKICKTIDTLPKDIKDKIHQNIKYKFKPKLPINDCDEKTFEFDNQTWFVSIEDGENPTDKTIHVFNERCYGLTTTGNNRCEAILKDGNQCPHKTNDQYCIIHDSEDFDDKKDRCRRIGCDAKAKQDGWCNLHYFYVNTEIPEDYNESVKQKVIELLSGYTDKYDQIDFNDLIREDGRDEYVYTI